MAKGMTAVLIGVALMIAVTAACNREDKRSALKKDEKIRVAVTPWPASAGSLRGPGARVLQR